MNLYEFQMSVKFFLKKAMKVFLKFYKAFFKLSYRFFLSGKLRQKMFFSFLVCFVLAFIYFTWIFLSLPRLLSMEDYKPPLLTEVYDRNQQKIGEFFKERRLLFDYESMPKAVVFAFVAAEDGSFFFHKGLNYKAILRAFLANLKAGRKVQGGSTITQQVARTLLLSSEKTYTRKFKEAVLSLRMENALSKQDILYIYLNQIYLGHGAYGIEMASQIYFRKSVKDIDVGEAALLAGLPKAPSRFSPIFNPERAKNRQIYVLNRMREEKYITEEEFKKFLAEPIKVYVREDFNAQSPHYLETIRRLLLLHFELEQLLESGLKIYTSLDLEKQKAAQKALKKGLEELDKRQGFRGVKKKISTEEEKQIFIKEMEKNLKKELQSYLTIPGFEFELLEQGQFSQDSFEMLSKDIKKAKEENFSLKDKKDFIKGKVFQALVSKVDSNQIEILTPFGLKTLLLESFNWAVPIAKKEEQKLLEHPREILSVNDIISIKVSSEEENTNDKKDEIRVEFYQEPLVEGSLLSFDLETSEVLALVGGYKYSRSQFNRTYQSKRQPGSVFKPFVYGSALEKGFTPASIISDTPVVFSDEEAEEKVNAIPSEEELDEESDIWRPSNINQRFSGDILFRTALIRSLNVPTVKIIEKIGLDWVRFYVRRLGVFSPLNSDFTMALGSSALTVYEVLKSFSVFPRAGKQIKPLLVHRVENRFSEVLIRDLSFDELFTDEIHAAKEFVIEEKERWFAKKEPTEKDLLWLKNIEEDSGQLIPEQSSFVLNSLLESVIFDSEGSGRRARALERPLAGKTGTTNGYYDAWFMGYSPFISTGVWVGFDTEKTLGRGETGSRSALPIWMDYMKESHKDIPNESFPIPENIVFVNIDKETGGLVSSQTKKPIRQAFIEGTEPHSVIKEDKEDFMDTEDESNFIKGDLFQ